MGSRAWASSWDVSSGSRRHHLCLPVIVAVVIVVIVNAIITTVFGRNSSLALSVAIQFSIVIANVAPVPDWLLLFCFSQLPVVTDI